MAGTQLNPEKITHPFQLMAAWFAMLILLIGVLLTAASKIETPIWVRGFLVISSVVVAILVMAELFMMLTKFRPHLQGPREYADWLKDERRFAGHTVQALEIKELRQVSATLPASRRPDPGDSRLFQLIATHPVEISSLSGTDAVLGALRALGFSANIYRPDADERYGKKADHSAIWIGSRVPSRVAVLAIKTVVRLWPHLRYLHLSTDGGAEPPDHIHDQMYFGGATSTAKRLGLQRWTNEEIERIPDNLALDEFHELIRRKYLPSSEPRLAESTTDAGA